jgi:hypothetical protein
MLRKKLAKRATPAALTAAYEKLGIARNVRAEDLPQKPACKYLRTVVEPDPQSEDHDRVNIRVPMNLIRAGLKWAAFVPKHAHSSINQALHEKGIEMDFTKITQQDIEELVSQLNDLTVEVEGREKVRICCE